MQTLRALYQDAPNLQVDLAALKLASPELNAPVATGPETSLALQLPSTDYRDWTAPAWSDPDADLPPSALSTDSIPDMELSLIHI